MATTADRLELLKNTKAAIKAAIESKGQEIDDNAPFSSYAEKIEAITTGGDEIDFTAHPDAYMAYRYLNSNNAISTTYVTDETQAIDYIENGVTQTPEMVLYLELQFSALCENLTSVTTLNRESCAMISVSEWGEQNMIIPNTVGGLQHFTHVTTLGDGFLQAGGFDGGTLKTLNGQLPPSLTTISNYFMRGQDKFSGTLDLFNLTDLESIGSWFMGGCSQFNSPITIPDTVTSLGESFLQQCRKFNSTLTLPPTLSLPAFFLVECEEFNQPITIPEHQTTIPASFLKSCLSFNQPLTFPSGLTSVGQYFLSTCVSYNQPLIFPNEITTIGSDFMTNNESFNSELHLPSNLTSIGNAFMNSCHNYNQPLTLPDTLTSVGEYFMAFCWAFNQNLNLPLSLTTLSREFMYQCNTMTSTITVNQPNIGVSPYSSGIFAVLNTSVPAYTDGIKVTGAGADQVMSLLPNGSTGGGAYRNLIKVN